MDCPRCLKTESLCICSQLEPIATQHHILILQHPQEPDKDLGTARIAHLALPNSTLKIGLSWPNLSRALGREAQASRWAVLYLGSGVKNSKSVEPLQFVSKQGVPMPRPEALDGIVILDGTWSQAKALWWRNAWLLKLRRAILTPSQKSLYRELRREPRRECLSTIESIAECLSALGESKTIEEKLKNYFSQLLEKQRARLKSPDFTRPTR